MGSTLDTYIADACPYCFALVLRRGNHWYCISQKCRIVPDGSTPIFCVEHNCPVFLDRKTGRLYCSFTTSRGKRGHRLEIRIPPENAILVGKGLKCTIHQQPVYRRGRKLYCKDPRHTRPIAVLEGKRITPIKHLFCSRHNVAVFETGGPRFKTVVCSDSRHQRGLDVPADTPGSTGRPVPYGDGRTSNRSRRHPTGPKFPVV